LLDSNELTGGLIVMNVSYWIESFLVWYTMTIGIIGLEDSFIIGVACGKKWGEAQKPESLGV